jgi:hypothetical protein
MHHVAQRTVNETNTETHTTTKTKGNPSVCYEEVWEYWPHTMHLHERK